MNRSEPIPQEEDDAMDWHPADIQAALKKRGHSLAGLSVAAGYHPTAAGKALKRPWPALEAVIAKAMEMTPEDIWPARYRARQRRARMAVQPESSSE